MPTLYELMQANAPNSDMRRMGEARTNAELNDALMRQAQLRETLGLNATRPPFVPAQGLPPAGPFDTMKKDIAGAMPQFTLMDLFRRVMPTAQAQER